MRYVGILFFAILFFVCATVFADGNVASEASHAVLGALSKAHDAIPTDVPPVVVILLGFLSSELLVRVVPTAKPRSLFLVLSAALSLVASIASKLSALLDKLVQNIKDPEVK